MTVSLVKKLRESSLPTSCAFRRLQKQFDMNFELGFVIREMAATLINHFFDHNPELVEIRPRLYSRITPFKSEA